MMHPSPAETRGFTLLEMLVVIVIAAILVSLAAVAIGSNPNRQLGEEAERLAQLFQSANDEAHLRAHLWAWQPAATGYRFLERRNGQWVTRTEAPFAPHTWPSEVHGYSIRLQGSNEALELIQFGAESIEPPLAVTLEGQEHSVTILATGDGRYEIR